MENMRSTIKTFLTTANTNSAEYKAYTAILRHEVKNSKTNAAKRKAVLYKKRTTHQNHLDSICLQFASAYRLNQEIPQLDAQVLLDDEAAAILAAQDDTALYEAEAKVTALRLAKRKRVEDARAHRNGDEIEEGKEGQPNVPAPVEPPAVPPVPLVPAQVQELMPPLERAEPPPPILTQEVLAAALVAAMQAFSTRTIPQPAEQPASLAGRLSPGGRMYDAETGVSPIAEGLGNLNFQQGYSQ